MKLFLLTVFYVPFVCAFSSNSGDPISITSMRVVKEEVQESVQTPLVPLVPTTQVQQPIQQVNPSIQQIQQPIQQPVQQVQQQSGYELIGVITKYVLVCGGVYFLINQIKKKYEQKNSDLQNHFRETVQDQTAKFQQVIQRYQERMDRVAKLSEDNKRVLEGLIQSERSMHQKADAIKACQERIDPVLRNFVDNYARLVEKVQVLWQAVRKAREKGPKSTSVATTRGASIGGAAAASTSTIQGDDLELTAALHEMERALQQLGVEGGAGGAATALPSVSATNGAGVGNGQLGAEAAGALNAQSAHVLDANERQDLGIPRN